MQEPVKRMKDLLRQHAKRAWEAEMKAALEPLAAKFEMWKSGAMSSADLDEAIHEYHNGTAREIWKRFSTKDARMAIAHAVASGSIASESLPPEVREYIAHVVKFFLERERDA